jgi:uncharacterized protein (DUF1800 family)
MSEFLRPWQPRASEWDRAAALHLYRRAGFGATAAELAQALDEGLTATVARLFEMRPATELENSIRPLLPTGELAHLQAWWVALLLDGGAPLRERMTLVWHDLFATSHDKVDDVRLMHGQNELFRSHALGDFRALLHGVARDPAMLRWLDGDSNRRGHPNENFAREVCELFALGRGTYDEHDVQELARAFTGWGTEGRAFVFRPEHHDAGAKAIFGKSGAWGGDEALELVLAHSACARHVARVLLEAFVAPQLAPAWIEALAQALVAADWNVGEVLARLLGSEFFFSPVARRSRIAGPVELLVAASRASGGKLAPARLAELSGRMGQALFRPPSVKGWDGGRAWIHSGHWIARHNALVAIAEAAEGEFALETLLPEASPEIAAGWRRLRDANGDCRAALALVLTTPEFQLF